ncbi:23161_t:CDS:1, partial [Racocetra persica]
GGNRKESIYVMLSRIQRLKDLMILQPFNQSKLNMSMDSDLKRELERLEKLSKITEQLITWPDATSYD